MNLEKKCKYCGSHYQKDKEHVFPYGLGGEDIYITCVCEKCNNDFSGLERELYQKSPVAFMRSIEGVEGYHTNKGKTSPFRAPLLLGFDEKYKIAYEVGQYSGLDIRLRPQIMSIADIFYLEADSLADIQALNKEFVEWRSKNLKMIIAFPKENQGLTKYIEFKQIGNQFPYNTFNEKIKVEREIIVDILDKEHELYPFLSPRLFMDDNRKLHVRCRTAEEAISFITKFAAFTLHPTPLKSFSNEPLNNLAIYVGQFFNPQKFDRAVVKIALNCLLHYFPDTRCSAEISNCISFVQTGIPVVDLTMGSKNTITDIVTNTHNIFFFQHSNGLFLTVSLFNGSISQTLFISELKILSVNSYARLLIDYKTRKNIFQTHREFHQSVITNN